MENIDKPTARSEKAIKKETALAQRVARIFGYDGLEIQIKDGAGWRTEFEDGRVTLVVDPTMLKPQDIHDATGEVLPDTTETPEQYSVYAMSHELGHIDDYMRSQLSIDEQMKLEKNRAFFWNVVDDAVINRRLRNIPLLNTVTDEVYEKHLFPKDNIEDVPKHLQFMYGWLLQNVTPQRAITYDPLIQNHLDDLKNVTIQGRAFDIGRTLAHPDTTIEERRSIATRHILPIYEQLLEQDKNDAKNSQDSNDQPNQGTDSNDATDESRWDPAYDSYNDAAHHHSDLDNESHGSSGDSGEPSPSDTNDTESNSHGDSITEAIREAAEALSKVKEAADAQQNQKSQNASRASREASSSVAGSVAAELEISPNDAAAYLAVLERYRSEIHQVGKVFQLLTVPSIEYNSPRYARRSDTTGLKLSPADLFQVAIAHHSEQDPAVWKPVESIAKKEGYSFNGLDVHLLIDSSGSMQGSKAEAAAACGVMLMEGLASARRFVSRTNPRAPKPDVRLQVIMFGSSMDIVAPLSADTDPADKGRAFTTARDAASNATIVAGALSETVSTARLLPNRTQLVFIISDGEFSDTYKAATVIDAATPNHVVYQHILQSPGTQGIAKNVTHINSPESLPGVLKVELQRLSAKLLSQ